jgi:hypothetical protein
VRGDYKDHLPPQLQGWEDGMCAWLEGVFSGDDDGDQVNAAIQ